MLEIKVNESAVMTKGAGTPLELMAELIHGTTTALEKIIKDCPDEHYAKIMKLSFVETITSNIL